MKLKYIAPIIIVVVLVLSAGLGRAVYSKPKLDAHPDMPRRMDRG